VEPEANRHLWTSDNPFLKTKKAASRGSIQSRKKGGCEKDLMYHFSAALTTGQRCRPVAANR
jgi:hypothetical protein